MAHCRITYLFCDAEQSVDCEISSLTPSLDDRAATLAEARRAAKAAGWLHRDGADICRACAEAEGGDQ